MVEKGIDIDFGPEDLADYQRRDARYKSLRDVVGRQMIGSGLGLTVDGQDAKVVLDDSHDAESLRSSGRVAVDFWGNETEKIPRSHRLRVFNLRTHAWLPVDVDALSDYRWRGDLLSEVVMPERDKRLVKALAEQTGAKLADIIEGKSSGTIVVASSPPGVGKTLTAEAVAETLEVPLYVVQCSQLGTDEDRIERNLKTVLDRASRWGAVLLIDEADALFALEYL